MQWQNLITKQCPICESQLVPENKAGFRCSDDTCTFFITRRKYVDILTDPTHVMRQHLRLDQSKALGELLFKVEQAKEEILMK